MAVPIQERIITGVVFDRARLQPVWFIWNGRRIRVREVTQRWSTREGSAALLHLGVSDGVNCFELVLNQQTLVWRLAAVESDPG